MLISLIRKLAGVHATITEDDALNIARADYNQDNVEWPNEIEIDMRQGITAGKVSLNPTLRGGTVVYMIDVRTAKIVSKWVAPC
jgi:hypothetical protein